jgi:hypothetical protein
MRRRLLFVAGLCILGLSGAAVVYARIAGSVDAGAPSVERGRYLVKIAGCNDCHTRSYAVQGGQVPEPLWLTGDELGWRGAWGTTSLPCSARRRPLSSAAALE